MKKIIHIFTCKRFVDMCINFIKENFDSKEHYFLLFGNKACKADFEGGENIYYKRDITLYLNDNKNIQFLLSFDAIFIHGLFDKTIINVWNCHRELYKKTYLYFYGGDFYPSKYSHETIIENIKRRRMIRNAAGIINILKVENSIITKLYHAKGKMFDAQYYDKEAIRLQEKFYVEKKQAYEKVRIQVGNSATEENNHLDILKKLFVYKNENMSIYVPLSYGNMDYARKVEGYGKKLFGNKFIAIKNYMTLDEYYKFMQEMDVAIVDVQRQQALANILAHLYYGNILYLNRRSVVNYHLQGEVGFKVRHTDKIGGVSFSKFSRMKIEDRRYNHDLGHKYCACKDMYIKQWEKIFDSIK